MDNELYRFTYVRNLMDDEQNYEQHDDTKYIEKEFIIDFTQNHS